MTANAPEVRFVRPGFEKLEPELSIPRHRHRFGYIAVVLRGGYREAGLSGRLKLEAGDVVIHRAFDSHLDHVAAGGAGVLNLPLPDGAALPAAFRISDPDWIARVAERDCMAAALSLVPVDAVARADDWPDDLAAELESGGEILLRTWANEKGLAPETVSRGFRSAYGITPAAFRAELRTHRALELVCRSGAPLAAIAADCGFADQPHLTRAIARLTGQAPGFWRRTSIRFKTSDGNGR